MPPQTIAAKQTIAFVSTPSTASQAPWTLATTDKINPTNSVKLPEPLFGGSTRSATAIARTPQKIGDPAQKKSAYRDKVVV
jgi:hypothetical protein